MPTPNTDDHKPLLLGYAVRFSKILLKKNADKPTTTIFWDSLTPTLQLWSYVKRQKVDHISIPPLRHNGNVIIEPSIKGNILNNCFSSGFNIENITSTHMPEESLYPDIWPLSFSATDTLRLLTSLDVHKAPGPDQILPHLLWLACHEIAPILTLIFNSSLHQGESLSSCEYCANAQKGDK